eukprot:jgi/Mesvir1/16339/Mv18088-RA.1
MARPTSPLALAKRKLTFALPSIIRRSKRGRRVLAFSLSPSPSPPASPPASPVRRRASAREEEEVWRPDDDECPDGLVGAPEMGLFALIPWSAFGNILNRLDCRDLSNFAACNMHHAVAVSTAMGLQGHAVIDSVNPLSLAGGALNAFGLARNPVGDAVSGAGKRVTSFIARHTPVAGLTQKGKSAGCRLARMLTYNFARC